MKLMLFGLFLSLSACTTTSRSGARFDQSLQDIEQSRAAIQNATALAIIRLDAPRVYQRPEIAALNSCGPTNKSKKWTNCEEAYLQAWLANCEKRYTVVDIGKIEEMFKAGELEKGFGMEETIERKAINTTNEIALLWHNEKIAELKKKLDADYTEYRIEHLEEQNADLQTQASLQQLQISTQQLQQNRIQNSSPRYVTPPRTNP